MKNNLLRNMMVCLLLVMSGGAMAQESPEGQMAWFRDVCIKTRQSVAKNDLDGIADCIAAFDDINAEEFTESDFKAARPATASSLKGHLLFSTSYLETLLTQKMDQESVEYDEHSTRAKPPGELKYAHALIPARKTSTFEYVGEGYMELLVVCEHEQLLGVKIDVHAQGYHHQIANKNADGIRFHRWDMKGEGTVKLSITNPTGKAVSVVVVSN